MSQNNSDNAELYTAQANMADATIKINRLEYKLERLNDMLKKNGLSSDIIFSNHEEYIS